MAAEAPGATRLQIAPREAAGIWVRHLVSLLLPVNALVFLFTGPHPWWAAPLFILPTVLAYLLDARGVAERRQPVESLPAWPFDSLVYLLAALQLLIVVGIGRLFAQQGFFSVDMALVFLVVGANSGFSIITAHELIHRRVPWERQLGRLLLCTVLQEHFYTEHLRGHHVRVGLDEDPATARFGESYRDFYRRTVPAQFANAWRLECTRLGDAQMSPLDPRQLRNRVVHGLAVGWGMALALLLTCGVAALAAFLIQAFFASRLLEAVNYFEHWGLRRRGSRVRTADSWDTHAWFTYYGLTGLSRHADHHVEPTRPFQQLRVRDDTPMLPTGYVGMVDLVMERNDQFQQLATEELRARNLGPFAEGGEPAVSPEPVSGEASGWLASTWAGFSPWLRGAIFFGAALLVTTTGVQLEWPGDMAFGTRLLLHAWIFAAIALVTRTRRVMGERLGAEAFSWLLAAGLLVALGTATDAFVGA